MEEKIKEIYDAKNFMLIAGPCVIESEENVMYVAEKMKGRSQRQGYLKFISQELQGLDMQKGDEKRFEEELALYEQKEKIFNHTNQAYELLYGGDNGVVGNLEKVCAHLEQIADLDKRLQEALQALQEVYYIAEDKSHVLGSFAREQFNVQERKQELEEKLYHLGRLKRKYNMSFEELLAEKEQVFNELQALDDKKKGKILELLRRYNWKYV